jgi:hypothetical protein
MTTILINFYWPNIMDPPVKFLFYIESVHCCLFIWHFSSSKRLLHCRYRRLSGNESPLTLPDVAYYHYNNGSDGQGSSGGVLQSPSTPPASPCAGALILHHQQQQMGTIKFLQQNK